MSCEHLSGNSKWNNPDVNGFTVPLKEGEFWCHNCKAVVPDAFWEEEQRVMREETCIRESYESECRGRVSGRASFAGTGTMIYECEKHMDESYERDRALTERYPAGQPLDFDPAYARESWYEEY